MEAGKARTDKAAGKDNNAPLFTMEASNIYRYRICNVGVRSSLNFRIQGHTMTLVELEGSHSIQNTYTSLDVHVGQCYSVLVIADKKPMDYYMVHGLCILRCCSDRDCLRTLRRLFSLIIWMAMHLLLLGEYCAEPQVNTNDFKIN